MTDINNDLIGSISITTAVKMTSKYETIGYDENDIISNISTKQHDNLNSTIPVYSDNVIDTIQWPAVYGNQKRSHVTVPYRSDLGCILRIRPNALMRSTFDIIEQPKIILDLQSTGDSFIRESIPRLNYGNSSTLLVGYSQSSNEHYRSLINFDLTSIPQDQTIDKVTLKLYVNKTGELSQNIGVMKPSSVWDEYGVTWQNQPYIGDFVSSQTITQSEQWISFDVTQYVTDCYDGNDIFNGFILKTLNDSQDQTIQFNSRESSVNPPILEVSYYDPVVYSFNKVDKLGSITVRQLFQNDFDGSLNVKGYNNNVDLNGQINVKYPGDMLSNIIVSRENLVSNIKARRSDKSELTSTIPIRVCDINEINGSITINAYQRIGKIYVPYRNDLTSSIYARALGKSQLNSNIIVNANSRVSTIYVKPYQDFNGSLDIRTKMTSDLSSAITLSRDSILSLISIFEHNSLNSNLDIRRIDINQLNGSIIINKNSLFSTLSAGLSSYFDSSIDVRQTDKNEINSNIVILNRLDLQGSIFVTGSNMIQSNIFVNSGYLASSIFVPHNSSLNLTSSINVQAIYISDIDSSMDIFYANKLNSNISVIQINDLESILIINVSKGYVFIM